MRAPAVLAAGGFQHGHRVGMTDLARDGLHGRAVDAVGVEDHAERIAREAPVVNTSSVAKVNFIGSVQRFNSAI